MPKFNRKYIDKNVYEMAKERIRHVINTFDTITVAFSGGKDSLTVLHLVEEVYKEMGIKEKVNVFFRDEEVIPDEVIKFVDSYVKQTDRFNFKYFALQLKSNKFILGKTYDYIQWDKNRRWIRPKPEYAITEPEDVIFDQYSMDGFIADMYKGKVAILNGIRADESLVRFASCLNRAHENYIANTDDSRVKFVKPIYDWTVKDVFKYFYDKKIKYCEIYDLEMWNNQELRVATPLIADNAKRFKLIKTLAPTFYEQIIDIFPEMLIQEKYWKEYDRSAEISRYPYGWEGVFQWIDENLSGNQKQMALKRVLDAKKTRENKILSGEGLDNYGGYPILYVFKSIIAGQFRRAIQPKSKPLKEEIEYEKLCM